jgi:hypothetical protein
MAAAGIGLCWHAAGITAALGGKGHVAMKTQGKIEAAVTVFALSSNSWRGPKDIQRILGDLLVVLAGC